MIGVTKNIKDSSPGGHDKLPGMAVAEIACLGLKCLMDKQTDIITLRSSGHKWGNKNEVK